MDIFSEREKKILSIIGRKKLTLDEISRELFKTTKDRPFDTNISVGNSVRRIIRKCSYHRLDWSLEKLRVNNKLIIRRN